MKSNVATGPDGEDWVQALVMCVPCAIHRGAAQRGAEQFGPVNGLAGTRAAARIRFAECARSKQGCCRHCDRFD